MSIYLKGEGPWEVWYEGWIKETREWLDDFRNRFVKEVYVVAVNDERETWEEFFLSLAALWATRSRDPSTKCGAVIVNDDNIVVSTGYNGLPRKVLDSIERLEDRNKKLDWTIHAEANAIVNAARIGSPVRGCDLYATPLIPCIDCTPLIINAGIRRIITDGHVWDDPDNDHTIVTLQLTEAGVPITVIERR